MNSEAAALFTQNILKLHWILLIMFPLPPLQWISFSVTDECWYKPGKKPSVFDLRDWCNRCFLSSLLFSPFSFLLSYFLYFFWLFLVCTPLFVAFSFKKLWMFSSLSPVTIFHCTVYSCRNQSIYRLAYWWEIHLQLFWPLIVLIIF